MVKKYRNIVVISILLLIIAVTSAISVFAVQRTLKYLPRNESVYMRSGGNGGILSVGNCRVSRMFLQAYSCYTCAIAKRECPPDCCLQNKTVAGINPVQACSVSDRWSSLKHPLGFLDRGPIFSTFLNLSIGRCAVQEDANTEACCNADCSVASVPPLSDGTINNKVCSCTPTIVGVTTFCPNNTINVDSCGCQELGCPIPTPVGPGACKTISKYIWLCPGVNQHNMQRTAIGNFADNTNKQQADRDAVAAVRDACPSNITWDKTPAVYYDHACCSDSSATCPASATCYCRNQGVGSPCTRYEGIKAGDCSELCTISARRYETNVDDKHCCRQQRVCPASFRPSDPHGLRTRKQACTESNDPNVGCAYLTRDLNYHRIIGDSSVGLNPLKCSDDNLTAALCAQWFSLAWTALNESGGSNCFMDIPGSSLRFAYRGNESVTLSWSLSVGISNLPSNGQRVRIPFYSRVVVRDARTREIRYESDIHFKEISSSFSIFFAGYIDKSAKMPGRTTEPVLETGRAYDVSLLYFYPDLSVLYNQPNLRINMQNFQLIVVKNRE